MKYSKIYYQKQNLNMLIERLDWDSDFFGINIGKIVIINESDFDPETFKFQAINNKFNLVYIQKTQSLLSNKIVKKANLELMDIQLTMSKIFNRNEYLHSDYDFKTNLSHDELFECYTISENIAIVSRFFREKLIGQDKTKALYRKWIDNTLNKQFSDGLFLTKDSSAISGLHIIKTDNEHKVGFCSLIGVSTDKIRSGIGKMLWEQSFGYWANETDIKICKVPFSLQNENSFNFHLKLGFNKIDEIKYIYHFRNK